MKSKFLTLVIILVGHVTVAQTLSAEERTFLVEMLEASSRKFLGNLQNINSDQWSFKPDSGAWSVGEIAEHITLSENLLYSIVEKTLLTPANEEKAQSLEGHEKQLLVTVMDRSSKAQAPEVLRPSGKFASKQELIDAFKQARRQTIAYVRTSNDSLKSHVAQHPVFGELTAYQWLIFIAGHADRHIDQLEEVKSNVNFPKI